MSGVIEIIGQSDILNVITLFKINVKTIFVILEKKND